MTNNSGQCSRLCVSLSLFPIRRRERKGKFGDFDINTDFGKHCKRILAVVVSCPKVHCHSVVFWHVA
jgi:hypothetical protein